MTTSAEDLKQQLDELTEPQLQRIADFMDTTSHRCFSFIGNDLAISKSTKQPKKYLEVKDYNLTKACSSRVRYFVDAPYFATCFSVSHRIQLEHD
jgi:hypothetical protein